MYPIWCIVVRLLLLTTMVDALDCPYKECTCLSFDIMCHDLELQSMPQILTQDNTFFTTLFLDRNPLTVIPGGSLPGNLTLLSLVDTSLTTIVYTAFNEMTETLESLTLSNASFVQIPDAFLHLNTLKNLHIYNSTIQNWNEEAMRHLGSTVEKLTLENVGLTTWPMWMQNYSHLTDLNLSGSLISFLPDNALDAMSYTLKSLSIVNSALTSVPRTLSKLNNLIVLTLENNHISDVAWLPQSRNLSFLSLRNNNISSSTQLSSALSFYGDSLYDLHVQQNQLTAIPDLDFLTHIVQLDLTGNLISEASSGSLPPALHELNLTFNSLQSIPHAVLDFKSENNVILNSNSINSVQGTAISVSTTGLEIGFNLITEITDASFPLNSKIIFLYLNNNPLATISNLAFQNLQHLYKLDLQYTKLTRLPLALSSLISITVFDITGTAGLVCTCLEKSLQSWVLSLAPGNVMGDCGQTSIYTFFETLSLSCP